MTSLQTLQILTAVCLVLFSATCASCVWLCFQALRTRASWFAPLTSWRPGFRDTATNQIFLRGDRVEPTLPALVGAADGSLQCGSDAGPEQHVPYNRDADRWSTLPGYRLALSATGFEISLEQSGPFAGAFVLLSPEGQGLFVGPNLDDLKRMGEQQAAYREQFDHPGTLAQLRLGKRGL